MLAERRPGRRGACGWVRGSKSVPATCPGLSSRRSRASIRLVQAPPLPIARQSIFSRREAGRVPFEPAPEALGRHVPVDALDSWEEVVLACDDETGEGR